MAYGMSTHDERDMRVTTHAIVCSAHVKCGENAPVDCGIRPPRQSTNGIALPSNPSSPVSKAKANGKTSSPK